MRALAVEASWEGAEKKTVTAKGETEVISANGALLRLDARHTPNHLTLRNPANGEESGATVLYAVDPGADGWMRFAVQLETKGEKFWGVKF